jgi:hypothetical protein
VAPGQHQGVLKGYGSSEYDPVDPRSSLMRPGYDGIRGSPHIASGYEVVRVNPQSLSGYDVARGNSQTASAYDAARVSALASANYDSRSAYESIPASHRGYVIDGRQISPSSYEATLNGRAGYDASGPGRPVYEGDVYVRGGGVYEPRPYDPSVGYDPVVSGRAYDAAERRLYDPSRQ